MIELREISVSLGSRLVLDRATLELRAGKVLGIVGPNGAGKSTLLRVMAGETHPAKGAVSIAGRDAASYGTAELARLRAMLPQSTDLAFDFSTRDLVLMGRTPHSDFVTLECRKLADAWLERMGLSDRGALPASSLSGGERQRAHLARVLVQVGSTGKYLLLDEPLSNQDPAWQLRILDELRALSRRDSVGIAVVLHDLDHAASGCDEVALLHRGRVVAQGTPKEVFTPEGLGEVFEVDAWVDPDPRNTEVPRVTFVRRSL
jgi:iron complex transport system ATP-binding protein